MSGYKVVPVEPTRAMIGAASSCVTNPDDLPSIGEGWTMSDLAFRTRYMAAIAAAPAVQGEPVGEAGSLPGTKGFATAVFESSKVPEGTKLYTAPQPAEQQPAPDVAGMMEALESALGSFDDWCEGQDPSDIADAIDTFPWVMQARTALAAHRKGGDA